MCELLQQTQRRNRLMRLEAFVGIKLEGKEEVRLELERLEGKEEARPELERLEEKEEARPELERLEEKEEARPELETLDENEEARIKTSEEAKKRNSPPKRRRRKRSPGTEKGLVLENEENVKKWAMLFQGGAALFPLLLGIWSRWRQEMRIHQMLQNNGLTPKLFIGSSSGCLVALLYAFDWKPMEAFELIQQHGTRKLLSKFYYSEIMHNWYLLRSMFGEVLGADGYLYLFQKYYVNHGKIVNKQFKQNNVGGDWKTHTHVLDAILGSTHLSGMGRWPLTYCNKEWVFDGGFVDTLPNMMFSAVEICFTYELLAPFDYLHMWHAFPFLSGQKTRRLFRKGFLWANQHPFSLQRVSRAQYLKNKTISQRSSYLTDLCRMIGSLSLYSIQHLGQHFKLRSPPTPSPSSSIHRDWLGIRNTLQVNHKIIFNSSSWHECWTSLVVQQINTWPTLAKWWNALFLK